MYKPIVLFCLLILVFASGCYYDNEEELYPNSFCDTVNVSYSGAISPIVQARCATPGCHVAGGSGTGDFTVFTELKEQVDNGRLMLSLRGGADAIPMPPDGALRDCEVEQFQLWVNAGAPND